MCRLVWYKLCGKYRLIFAVLLLSSALILYLCWLNQVTVNNNRLHSDLYDGNSTCYGNVKIWNQSWLNSHDRLQPVGVNETISYAFTAYIDDRRAPDVRDDILPVVRIFTYFRRGEQITSHWLCLFWYLSRDLPVGRPVIGWTDLNTFERTYRTMPAMVLCQLPATSDADVRPMAVSLVTSRCEQPQNILRLVDLRERRQPTDSKDSRPITNQSLYQLNFSVCLSAVYGNRYQAKDLLEFIEVNRLFGAQKFVFYVESVGEELMSCLRNYERLGLVELIPWTVPPSIADLVHYHGQILVITDCVYRLMYTSKYVISQDVDEFVVPTTASDWQSMLDAINGRSSKWQNIASYNFRNRDFLATPPEIVDTKIIIDPFVKKYSFKTLLITEADRKVNYERSKVMLRPDRVIMCHVHTTLVSSLLRRGDFNFMVHEDDGSLYHYRQNGHFDNARNFTRLLDFKSQITSRLNANVKLCIPHSETVS